jgi:hypothetical protein
VLGVALVTEPRVRALELRVGRVRIALPVSGISRVLALACAPLPLAHRLVAGLGFHDARAIVCVTLTPSRLGADTVKVVLLDSPGRVGFGLCIEEALDLVEIVAIDRGAVQASLPRWVRRARTADGRTLGWIDSEVLIDELSARQRVAEAHS